jgi:hypothetical protein
MEHPVVFQLLFLAVVIGFICGYFVCKIKITVKKHDIKNVLYRDTEI